MRAAALCISAMMIGLGAPVRAQDSANTAAPASQSAATAAPVESTAMPLPKRLGIGDKAPPLVIGKWVKGDPLKEYEAGKFYVVEFWATWCPPCIRSFPHLTEIQQKYKDKGLRVVGVTSADENGNTLDAVTAMVEKNGDEKMGYSIAWDNGIETTRAFMEAARRGGIPCSFIIDKDGAVAWIGHPMEMDGPLEHIIAGKFDRKSIAEKIRKEQDQAEEELALSKDLEGLEPLLSEGKIDDAVQLIDSQFAKHPKSAAFLATMKFRILIMVARDPGKAFAWAKEAADKHFSESGEAMNEIAWAMLDLEDAPNRDLDLAMTLAERACKLEPESPAYADTLARAFSCKKQYARAVETQKKAIELAKKLKIGDEELQDFEARLKEYEKAAEKKD